MQFFFGYLRRPPIREFKDFLDILSVVGDKFARMMEAVKKKKTIGRNHAVRQSRVLSFAAPVPNDRVARKYAVAHTRTNQE